MIAVLPATSADTDAVQRIYAASIGKAQLLPAPWRLKCVRANQAALAFYGELGWREVPSGKSEHGPFAALEWFGPVSPSN